MDIKSKLQQIETLSKGKDELYEKNERLQESIRQQLVENTIKADSLSDEQELLMGEVMDALGLDSLLNVEIAQKVYDTHWRNGVGSRFITDKLEKLIQEIPYLRVSNHITSDDGNRVVTLFQLLIPRGAEESKLRELARILEKILHTQKEILGQDAVVYADVLDDPAQHYYSPQPVVLMENGEYEIGTDRYSTLYDALVAVRKNAGYGATEEYEKKHPNWREEPFSNGDFGDAGW